MSALSSGSLEAVLRANRQLTHVSLEKSFNAVTDHSLLILAEHCPHIRTLSLACCIHFTGQGLEYVSHACRDLTELSLAQCYNLPSEALCQLAADCRRLTILTLEC